MAILDVFINVITKLLKYKNCTCTEYVTYIYVAQFSQFTDQKKMAFPKTVKGLY